MAWFLFLVSAAWLSQLLVERGQVRRERDRILANYNALERQCTTLQRELDAIATELNTPTAALLRSIVLSGRLPGSAREVTIRLQDGTSHVVNSDAGRWGR